MNEESISNLIVEYQEKINIELLKKNLKNEEIFEDQYFLPNKTSLTSNINDTDEFIKKITWNKEINKNMIDSRNLKNTQILFNGKNFENLKICFDIMKNRKNLIIRLFENLEINKNGMYGIWLNIDCIWRLYLIDNYLPYIKDKDLNENIAYLRSNDSTLWCSLLTKAIAKAKGNYENINSLNSINLLYEWIGISPKIKKLIYTEKLVKKLKKYSEDENLMVLCYRSELFDHTEENIIKVKELKYNYINKIYTKNSLLYVEIFDSNNEKSGIDNKYELLFYDFVKEYDTVSFFNLSYNYINNFKYDNKKNILFRFYVKETSKIEINLIQDNYFKDENKYGINNNELEKTEDYVDDDYKRSRIPLFDNKNFNNIYSLCKFDNFKKFKHILWNKFNERTRTEFLVLKKGEYYFSIKSDWKPNEDKIHTLTCQINSINIIEIQNMNKNLVETINYVQKKNLHDKLLKSKIDKLKSYELLKIEDNIVNCEEYFWKDSQIQIYWIKTDSKKNLKLNFKINELIGYHNDTSFSNIKLIISQNNSEILFFRKMEGSITNKINFKLEKISILEEYENKIQEEEINNLINYPKDIISKNIYYILNKEEKEESNCNIY